MAVHRSRRDKENMLRMAVAAYTFESKARGTSKWKGKRHWFWLHVRWDTSKIPKRDAENGEIYLGTQLVNCRCTHTHTHPHILSLMTDSHDRFKAQHTRKGQQKCDVYSLRNGCDPLISRAEGRVHRRAACEIKQKIGHRFSISKWPEGSRSVLCGPHTLILSLMTDSRHSIPDRGNKSVLSLRNGYDPPVSWLPHIVLRAESRAACTVVQLARSSKK